jgi:hypothetical protein
MQIIIVQAEIETAIRNYITSQINLREGQNITVDLTATRGEAGFKAVIDIMPITATHSPVTLHVMPAKTAEVATVVNSNAVQTVLTVQPKTAAEMRQTLEAEYEAEAKKEAEVVVEAKVETPVAEAATTETPTESVVVQTLDAPADSGSETSKHRSLFGGLRRPTNPPAGS